MHIRKEYSWLKHIDFIIIDLVILVFSFSVNYSLKFKEIEWWILPEWVILLIFLCLLDLIITFLINPYSGILRRSITEDGIAGLKLTIYSLVVSCFFFYLLKVGILFSREMLFKMYMSYYVLGIGIKYIWKLIIGKNHKRIRLYVVCQKGKEKEVIYNALSDDVTMYEIVGSSNNNDFSNDLLSKNAQEVLIAINPGEISKETFEILITNGIGIHLNIESLTGLQTENQQITRVGIYNTLSVGIYSFTPEQLMYLWIKRVFDILCSLICLIPFVMVVLIVKICSLLENDKDSIIFTQERIGLDGKPFLMYKFRSMVSNADEILVELLKDEKYKKEWEEEQKLKDDPRITKIGCILRRTSLDELPQLINVLKGDMSIVGPRPLVDGELEAHNGLKLYNQVKPGITGWWGCNGRSNINYHERLELEYYYVKHCSLYLDVLCIFKTIFAVIKKDGSR